MKKRNTMKMKKKMRMKFVKSRMYRWRFLTFLTVDPPTNPSLLFISKSVENKRKKIALFLSHKYYSCKNKH